MDMFTDMLSARLEFEALCIRIVHDGRDPLIVAHALTQQLSEQVTELQNLAAAWPTMKGSE